MDVQPKTPCRMPFSAALEASSWREYLQRFTNQQDCTKCKRELTQDTDTGYWYPSEECQFGLEPKAWDRVHPVTTQQGFFCGEECAAMIQAHICSNCGEPTNLQVWTSDVCPTDRGDEVRSGWEWICSDCYSEMVPEEQR